jgi:glycosyltransferase involved in cell wall biosynthesis
MSDPLVSVLVTVYNRAEYLRECLDSVLASTYGNRELIIVDDCSTDGSVEIAREYAERDDRVELHVNEKNLGDYPNRNRAASYARGKYLKYLDADDVIYRHSLRIMVEAMEEYPEASLGLSQNVIDDRKPYPHLAEPAEAYRSFFLGPNVLGVGPSAAIIRRESFEQVGGFSGHEYIGDTELWLGLVRLAPLVKLQPSLVWWRHHPGQQIKSEREDPEALAARYELKMSVLAETESLLTQRDLLRAVRMVRYRFARDLWNLAFRKGNLRDAFRVFRTTEIGLAEMLHSLVVNIDDE